MLLLVCVAESIGSQDEFIPVLPCAMKEYLILVLTCTSPQNIMWVIPVVGRKVNSDVIILICTSFSNCLPTIPDHLGIGIDYFTSSYVMSF